MEPQRELLGRRNQIGLSQQQIEYCLKTWDLFDEHGTVPLDTSQAQEHSSRTRYVETLGLVILGADAYPGLGVDARSRMSTMACLAHEWSHAERHGRGYNRPVGLRDEAEASVNASFLEVLTPAAREDLVEDARDRLTEWLQLDLEAQDAS